MGERVKSLDDIHKPLHMDMRDFGLRRIPDGLLEVYGVDMNPDYQRGHRWTLRQRREYLGFLLQGGQTLPIVVNMPEGLSSPTTEMVDGKQRITSICKWLDGEFTALTYDGREIHVDDLKEDRSSWILLNTNITLRVGFVELTRAKVLDYYLRLNAGGTVHTKEEIERVHRLLEKETSN